MGIVFFILCVFFFVFISSRINTLENDAKNIAESLTSKCPPHKWGLIIDGKFKHRDLITLEDKGYYLCSECGHRPNNEPRGDSPY